MRNIIPVRVSLANQDVAILLAEMEEAVAVNELAGCGCDCDDESEPTPVNYDDVMKANSTTSVIQGGKPSSQGNFEASVDTNNVQAMDKTGNFGLI